MTTDTPDLSLDAALFVSSLKPVVVKLRLIEIVRARRDEAIRLNSPPATQHLLHRPRQVVIARQAKHPPNQSTLGMRLQERPL
jgi:hypothetical protein